MAVFANLLIAWLLHPAATEDNLNVRAALLHVIGDVLNAVAVVLCGLVLWKWPSAYVIDPMLAFGIGIWLIVSSYSLGTEALCVLMQMAPEGVDVEALRGKIAAIRGVQTVANLEVWALAPGDVYVQCKVQPAEGLEASATLQMLAEINALAGLHAKHVYAAVEF